MSKVTLKGNSRTQNEVLLWKDFFFVTKGCTLLQKFLGWKKKILFKNFQVWHIIFSHRLTSGSQNTLSHAVNIPDNILIWGWEKYWLINKLSLDAVNCSFKNRLQRKCIYVCNFIGHMLLRCLYQVQTSNSDCINLLSYWPYWVPSCGSTSLKMRSEGQVPKHGDVEYKVKWWSICGWRA